MKTHCGMVLLLAILCLLPLTAHAQETVVVEPAATVSWDELLLYERLVPRIADRPKVVPNPSAVTGFDLGSPVPGADHGFRS